MNLIQRLGVVLSGKAVHQVDDYCYYFKMHNDAIALFYKIDDKFVCYVNPDSPLYYHTATNFELYIPAPTEENRRSEFADRWRRACSPEDTANILFETFEVKK